MHCAIFAMLAGAMQPRFVRRHRVRQAWNVDSPAHLHWPQLFLARWGEV